MEYQNPVLAVEGIDHGDPAVLKHEGLYYLYHTGETEIRVYRSANLIDWEYGGPALRVSDDPNHWAQIQLWAPEVIYENGTFYMYVAAARKRADGSADDRIRRIGVATSDHPLGPFQWEAEPLTDEWSIDAHPFKDDDGAYYLFYNVRNDETKGPNGVVGCGNVVDRMLDLKTLAGRPTLVVKPEFPWEGNKEQTWFWNEGPFVLKKGGVYYQMYSAGFYGDETYGIYVATSREVNGRGWTKWAGGKPLLRSNGACLGPGHHVVVKGPNGIDDYVVHHGYPPGGIGQGRRVYVSRMRWQGNEICIEPPAPGRRPYPREATFDGRWIEEAERLNARLASHCYEHFLLETSMTLQGSEASGAIVAEDQRFVWRWTFDAAARQLRFQSGDETAVVPLSHDYRFEVSHQLQIWKQAGTIRFMLDRVCRYEATVPIRYAFVQLGEGDGAQYKGTILQNLTTM